jgi:hypothetical protein
MGDQPLLTFALTAGLLVGGTLSTYAYDSRTPLLWRLPAGWCTGLAAYGLFGLLLASWFGLTPAVAFMAGAPAMIPLALLLVRRHRQAVWRDAAAAGQPLSLVLSSASKLTIARGLVYAIGLVILWRVAARVMFIRSDGIFTGASHNLGDLPFHLSIINRLLMGGGIPPEHPSYAGAAFTYPYLPDVIAALFVSTGVPVRDVFVWSTWLLIVAFAALVYRWTLTLTGSRAAAFLAPILTVLNGGLGWWLFVTEAWSRSDGLLSLLRLSHDYTITYDNEFRWGNIVTTLMVTQRGLLLGLPLAVIVFQQWWQATVESDDSRQARLARMTGAGVIAALLPLVHAHTYAVVIGVGVLQALLAKDRAAWAPFFVAALVLGLPQVWSLAHASDVSARSMVAWSLGWDHGRQPVALFWLKNTGLLIPLIVLALCWRGDDAPLPSRLVRFYLPFTLCFVIPNLFRLAPWVWDNVKVLIYWFLASVPVVAVTLVWIARGAWWRRQAVSAIVASLILAGALDVWRVASNGFEARIIDRAGMDFAARVAAVTDQHALVLHAPTYAHPIVLTGRRSFMGYPGHLWSHGLDPGPREADIKVIYAGTGRSAALLAQYRIDYVVVGPLERRQMPVNDAFFSRFVTVAESRGYRLHRVEHD